MQPLSTCVALEKNCLDLFKQTSLLPPIQWWLSQLQEFFALPEVLISLKVRTFLALAESIKTQKERHLSLISSFDSRMR